MIPVLVRFEDLPLKFQQHLVEAQATIDRGYELNSEELVLNILDNDKQVMYQIGMMVPACAVTRG